MSLIFDIETAPLPDAADYIELGDPPANYRKDEAIAKWQEEERAKQLAKAALDVDLCRVVAIAHDQACVFAQDVTAEANMLMLFWRLARPGLLPVVGFNVLQFDLPVLYRRSLYLGVKPYELERGKYRHGNVIDLADLLSEQGRLRLRSLDFYCRRFGIGIPSVGTGADVPTWVSAGQWDQVEAHVRADVARTAALAQRMGCI
uniref:Putative DNA polymerase n=1 Tax=viral metagenome TaxID=1070528 RepID=A0A6M3JYB0_9ZZZZ